jgi:hypothetical protein
MRRRSPPFSLPALALLTATSYAAPARALSPPDDEAKSLPCRPTIACTADIVKPGSFELETGMLYRNFGGTRQWTIPFLAKLSVTNVLQIQIGSNGFTTLVDSSPAVHFLDNLTFGMKLHVLDQGKLAPALAFSGAVGVPVMTAQPGFTPDFDAFATAYVTKDFGPLHADLNLGINDWAVGDATIAQEWVALALSVPLPHPFGAMVENYYFSDALPFSGKDGGCLFALSLTPRPWLVFDFGGDIGYFPETRSYSAFVGMTVVPFLLWH